MSNTLMVSWAIAVVGEFDAAGRRIPEALVPLLPMVSVVLWAREQPSPLRVEDLQARFDLSRATAYRWLTALQEVHDPDAARRRLPDSLRLRGAVNRELALATQHGDSK